MRSTPYRPPCRDCAFRPGSKELLAFVLFHAGPLSIKLRQINQHARHGQPEVPFFCHQGMPTDAEGHFVPQRDAAGVPLGENLCGGYRNVLEDERQDLDDGWLLQAVRATRELARARVEELRAAGRSVYAAQLDLLLEPGEEPDRRRRSEELRRALLDGARCRFRRAFDAEELAEVLSTGGPSTGLPPLVTRGASWAADPARCSAPPSAPA